LPAALPAGAQILIGHGSGGGMTRDLIVNVFQKYLGNAILNAGNDSALLADELTRHAGSQMVVSTDGHVVSPLSFPGGDIGRLAVCGTVNDVAMLGAQPRYLTANFILEEGFSITELEQILASMADACREAEVEIIAADTKVTEKGKSDKLFISTTGIGWAPAGRSISGQNAGPETPYWFPVRWEITASPSCRRAVILVFNPKSAPTPLRSTTWSGSCVTRYPMCTRCGTQPAAGWQPP
jgi:hydrogenase expression/formation protein HypE